ncbi:MAG: ATP-grasp domain-containing protein [Acidimicrobiia bacterium]
MSAVLVTGAGGAAGVAVVRALVDRGEHVVAIDADPLAVGLFLADDHAVVEPATSDAFLTGVDDVVKRFDVDAVLCTVAEEMLRLAGHRTHLADLGAAIWHSPSDAVGTCIDKLAFADAMEAAGLPVPATASAEEALRESTVAGPWIVKPRRGRGSRDVYAVDELDELAWACRRVPEPIVQTRLDGREFTVDVLVDRDGVTAGAIPRWRLATKAGISTQGRTFSDPMVATVASAAAESLGLRGPVNVQGFVDPDGAVSLVEVNPRFSGGLPLTLAAGADVVGETLRATRGRPVRADHLDFEPGVIMTRHLTEVFLR